MSLTHTSFAGWKDCLRLANDRLEIVCATEAGPRLLRLGAPGDPNYFWSDPATPGPCRDDNWHSYGGHRLWQAPEDRRRTYQPDNEPVSVTRLGERRLRLTGPLESATGLRKSLELWLHARLPWVSVTHRLLNEGLWSIRLAPWGISVMAPGGVAVLPLPPTVSHAEQVTPNRPVILWSYTNPSDSRLEWRERDIRLRHAATATTPAKIGMPGSGGCAWYLHPEFALVKTLSQQPGATYPDFGCAVEAYSCAQFVELETLGPLQLLAPGEAAVLQEDWLALPASLPPLAEAELTQLPLPLRRAHAERPEA